MNIPHVFAFSLVRGVTSLQFYFCLISGGTVLYNKYLTVSLRNVGKKLITEAINFIWQQYFAQQTKCCVDVSFL